MAKAIKRIIFYRAAVMLPNYKREIKDGHQKHYFSFTRYIVWLLTIPKSVMT